MGVQLLIQPLTDDAAADPTASSVTSRGDDSTAASMVVPAASNSNRAAHLCRPQVLSCLDPLSLLRCSSACRRLRRAVATGPGGGPSALQRAAGQMSVAVITAGCERAFLRSPLSARRQQLRVVRRVLAADGGGVALALYLPALSPFEPRPRDWPQQLRALISAAAAAAAAGGRPLRELRLVNGASRRWWPSAPRPTATG